MPLFQPTTVAVGWRKTISQVILTADLRITLSQTEKLTDPSIKRAIYLSTTKGESLRHAFAWGKPILIPG